jgi:hypothetical protein
MSTGRKTLMVTLNTITHEEVIHSQIRSLKEILNREVEIKPNLNKRESASLLEFQVFEREVRLSLVSTEPGRTLKGLY